MKGGGYEGKGKVCKEEGMKGKARYERRRVWKEGGMEGGVYGRRRVWKEEGMEGGG